MITKKTLSRRTMLRGAGTAIALPMFDAMAPAMNSSSIPGKAPIRMAFTYVPNGLDMRHWTPKEDGAFVGELPKILKPMESMRQDMTILSNLTQNNGRALLDGAGDHGRCCGAYLTGVQPMVNATADKATAMVVAQRRCPRPNFMSHPHARLS